MRTEKSRPYGYYSIFQYSSALCCVEMYKSTFNVVYTMVDGFQKLLITEYFHVYKNAVIDMVFFMNMD